MLYSSAISQKVGHGLNYGFGDAIVGQQDGFGLGFDAVYHAAIRGIGVFYHAAIAGVAHRALRHGSVPIGPLCVDQKVGFGLGYGQDVAGSFARCRGVRDSMAAQKVGHAFGHGVGYYAAIRGFDAVYQAAIRGDAVIYYAVIGDVASRGVRRGSRPIGDGHGDSPRSL